MISSSLVPLSVRMDLRSSPSLAIMVTLMLWLRRQHSAAVFPQYRNGIHPTARISARLQR
ncbi:unknown [Bacillus thuringiensis phage MZTP02]|uniref:Uncharacterized protein n=1 Tax=Bacillus thuringiensis phage MZTP02 TaxID=311221 RepID=Q56AQ7_9CAUD|nr:unknown [Bacillus thuringiensis phage MZTP02]